MAEPFVGQIKMFAGSFAPRNYALCDGQLLAINQNDALFSLLGTTYGGDGRTTFGLPDLRGRAPIHAGSGPGLTNRRLGEKTGEENATLTPNQIPAHSHALKGTSDASNSYVPGGRVMGKGFRPPTTDVEAFVSPSSLTSMSSTSLTEAAGGGTPHNNMQPYLVINFIIALYGTYPSRF